MKKLLLSLSLLAAAGVSYASITISGTSLFSSDIADYTTGVYISASSSTFAEGDFASIDAGLSFTTGTAWSLGGNTYTVLGSNSIITNSGSGVFSSGSATYDLSTDVATGNEIGMLVFLASSGSTSSGDTFRIYTGDWLVPADGTNQGVTGSTAPYTGAAAGAGTVVPEPSTYAMIAGMLALGYVMVRRRR